METILNWDTRIFLQLNGLNSGWWDTAMLFFTRKESWLPLYLLLLFLIIRNYRSKAWLILVFLLIGLVVSDQLSGIIKDIVQRYRPGYNPDIRNLTHIVLRKGGEYGFPSSHAANTFFVMTFTGYLFRNRYSFLIFLIWALLVSYSRIYVGAHFPLDILGGWIIGFTAGWLFYRLMIWVESRATGRRSGAINKSLSNPQAGLLTLVLGTVLLTLLCAVYILHKYNFL
jgi:undecaprenyl-diphosphatase